MTLSFFTPDDYSQQDRNGYLPLQASRNLKAQLPADTGTEVAAAAQCHQYRGKSNGGFVFRLYELFTYGHEEMSSELNQGAMFPTWREMLVATSYSSLIYVQDTSFKRILSYGLRETKPYWQSARFPSLIAAFGVRSHLTLEERVWLYEMSQSLNSIAEIGSYIGASACCFGAAMKHREVGGWECLLHRYMAERLNDEGLARYMARVYG